jgi:hypothetical protein
VASYVRGGTSPGDHILIWGFESLIYFLADRPPASRFVYSVPLVTAWSPPEWRGEIVSDIDQKRPACIVVAHNDHLPWMTGRGDDSAAQLEEFAELYGMIQADYGMAKRIGDFDIWERRDPAR